MTELNTPFVSYLQKRGIPLKISNGLPLFLCFAGRTTSHNHSTAYIYRIKRSLSVIPGTGLCCPKGVCGAHVKTNQLLFVTNQQSSLIPRYHLGSLWLHRLCQVSYPSGQQVQVCPGQSHLTLLTLCLWKSCLSAGCLLGTALGPGIILTLLGHCLEDHHLAQAKVMPEPV